jgi:hypothetical protein
MGVITLGVVQSLPDANAVRSFKGEAAMPVTVNSERKVEDFVRLYPETLPERLEWLVRELRIDPRRLMGLMGLSPEQIMSSVEQHQSWSEIIERHQCLNGALWTVDLLGRLLFHYGYDVPRLAAVLEQSAAGEGDEGLLIRVGGGSLVPLGTLSPDTRDAVLLPLISADHPQWPLLVAYLSLGERVRR